MYVFLRVISVNMMLIFVGVRAEDVVTGLNRMPIGFYVVVQFDGTKRRTINRPVRLHDIIVEWDDKIQM